MKNICFLLLLFPAAAALAQLSYPPQPLSPCATPGSERFRAGGSFDEGSDFTSINRYSRRNSSFNAYGTVASFGYGGRGTYSTPLGKSTQLEYSGGWINLPGSVTSNIEGRSAIASVIPIFVGARFDFAEVRGGALRWTSYVQGGGGPLAGLEYAPFGSFFEFFNRLAFRWGAGAYAGLGTELRMSEGWGGFARLELDAFGFLSPLAGRDSYIGPSFAFGIQRFIW